MNITKQSQLIYPIFKFLFFILFLLLFVSVLENLGFNELSKISIGFLFAVVAFESTSSIEKIR